MAMVNMYGERDKNNKIIAWSTDKTRHFCKHKLSPEEFKKYKVHVKWFLEDGTELVSRAKRPQWELKKHDGKT
jgi:hypothetical protein